MATKTITIMEDAYESLAREKLPSESFSDTIRRITNKKSDIMDFFGVWDEKTANAVKSSIEEGRKSGRERAKVMEKRLSV